MALYGRDHVLSDIIFRATNIRVEDFPRYRGVSLVNKEGPFEDADFLVYTYMKGENRECQGDSYDEYCSCSVCEADRIEEKDWCLGSYDEEIDCTYRTFVIKLNREQRKRLKQKIEEFESY